MTSQDDITPDIEDVEGHRVSPKPLLPDDTGADDVEGHRVSPKPLLPDDTDDDVEGHMKKNTP